MTPSGTPLMDSASIFNASRPRPRGREGQFNSSMPSPLGANNTIASTARSGQPYSTPPTARSGRSFEILASTQQQQQGTPTRPMSAYTASHTSHDEGFQETKSLTMAYIPTLLSQNGFQTSITISGMDGFNETPSEATGDTYQHTKHNNSYQTRDMSDDPTDAEKRALAEEAALSMQQSVLV